MKKLLSFLLVSALSVGSGMILAQLDYCAGGSYLLACTGYNALIIFLIVTIIMTCYSFLKSKITIMMMERDNKIKAIKKAEALQAVEAEHMDDKNKNVPEDDTSSDSDFNALQQQNNVQ